MLKHNFCTTAVTLPHIFRCKQWVGNCHRPDLETKTAEDLHKNYKLCSKHFETSMICQQVSEHLLLKKKRNYLLDVNKPSENNFPSIDICRVDQWAWRVIHPSKKLHNFWHVTICLWMSNKMFSTWLLKWVLCESRCIQILKNGMNVGELPVFETTFISQKIIKELLNYAYFPKL